MRQWALFAAVISFKTTDRTGKSWSRPQQISASLEKQKSLLSCFAVFSCLKCSRWSGLYIHWSFSSYFTLQMRTRRHRGILAAEAESFSLTTRRRRSPRRVGGAGRRREGVGFTPGEPSRTTRTRKTIRMMRLATLGSSAPIPICRQPTGNLR